MASASDVSTTFAALRTFEARDQRCAFAASIFRRIHEPDLAASKLSLFDWQGNIHTPAEQCAEEEVFVGAIVLDVVNHAGERGLGRVFGRDRRVLEVSIVDAEGAEAEVKMNRLRWVAVQNLFPRASDTVPRQLRDSFVSDFSRIRFDWCRLGRLDQNYFSTSTIHNVLLENRVTGARGPSEKVNYDI
jgi:hypothetical protein